jgi:DNA-binding MarR family transcriptional regulator
VPKAANATDSASELRVVLGRLIRRLRREYTLPISHVTVLSRLERNGPRTTSALAHDERVRPQSMAQTIADLADEGLVERRPDPGDRRQTLIELTALGRETLRLTRARRDDWLARAISDELSHDEQEIIARAIPLLGRIADL